MTINANAKLNHMSFPTTNPAATAAFFEQHLGCEIAAFGNSYLLKRNGYDIVLDYTEQEVVWPKSFHFGLECDTLAEVEALYQEFLEAGVHMETEVFNNSRGSRFFCRTPGGVMVEINTRSDMQEKERWQKLFD